MLEINLASTREDAVFLANRFLKEMNLFYHVNWDHAFKDGSRYLYRFNNHYHHKGININHKQHVVPQAGPHRVSLSRQQLKDLAIQFEQTIRVSKHRSGFFNKAYLNTFSGSEAVDGMMECQIAFDRNNAVYIGQRLMEELSLLHLVSNYKHYR